MQQLHTGKTQIHSEDKDRQGCLVILQTQAPRKFQATSCDLAGPASYCCYTPGAREERGFGVLEKKHSWVKEGLALQELNQSAPQPALRSAQKVGEVDL